MGTDQVVGHRQSFLADLAIVFAGTMYSKTHSDDLISFQKTLSRIGINTNDSAGWLSMIDKDDLSNCVNSEGRCGDIASKYQKIRELGTSQLLERMDQMLIEQRDRIERLESFVYMNCIANQIEKHFSKSRAEALAGKVSIVCIISNH